MDAFTENLIEKFFGFDNDWETESETCSDEEKSFQMYESRGAFFNIMKQIKFIKKQSWFLSIALIKSRNFIKRHYLLSFST